MNLLFSCAFILLCFSVSAQNPKAAAYNNKIIDIQHKLTPKVVRFLGNFENREKFQSVSLAELKQEKEALIKDFDKAIKKVDAIKPFESDASLRDAALKWFILYKETLSKEYDLLIEILSKKELTEADKLKAKSIIEEMHKREEEIDKHFEEAQEAFAKSHNLEIKHYPIEN